MRGGEGERGIGERRSVGGLYVRAPAISEAFRLLVWFVSQPQSPCGRAEKEAERRTRKLKRKFTVKKKKGKAQGMFAGTAFGSKKKMTEVGLGPFRRLIVAVNVALHFLGLPLPPSRGLPLLPSLL